MSDSKMLVLNFETLMYLKFEFLKKVFRRCITSWGVPEIEKKFNSLHALANLLVVVPENLPEACNSQLLVFFKLNFYFQKFNFFKEKY
jgi:hypothetical protein